MNLIVLQTGMVYIIASKLIGKCFISQILRGGSFADL